MKDGAWTLVTERKGIILKGLVDWTIVPRSRQSPERCREEGGKEGRKEGREGSNGAGSARTALDSIDSSGTLSYDACEDEQIWDAGLDDRDELQMIRGEVRAIYLCAMERKGGVESRPRAGSSPIRAMQIAW